MDIKIVILLYVLVGILRLVSEFFRPIPRRPIYLIERNFIGMLISILFWPLIIVIRVRGEWLIKKPKIEINSEVIKKTKEDNVNLDETDFKIRCPNCGYYGLGIIDKEGIKCNKVLYDQINAHNDKITDLSNLWDSSSFRPENTPIICKKCGHQFKKDDSVIWEQISKKFGNKMAIIEYHRRQKENEIDENDE